MHEKEQENLTLVCRAGATYNKRKTTEVKSMRILMILLAIPVMIVVKMVSVIIETAAQISAVLAGPFLIFVIGCGIYCAVTANWKSLIILAVTAGAVVFVYALIGIVLGLLDLAGNRMKRFIRS